MIVLLFTRRLYGISMPLYLVKQIYCCLLYDKSEFKGFFDKEGTKTIELRLFDEKRRKIQIGGIIEFSNTETGEKIGAKVSAQYVFDSFESLYKELSLLECGYTEADIETASPDDMNVYYSKDNQQKYGVVGIRIALLCGT